MNGPYFQQSQFHYYFFLIIFLSSINSCFILAFYAVNKAKFLRNVFQYGPKTIVSCRMLLNILQLSLAIYYQGHSPPLPSNFLGTLYVVPHTFIELFYHTPRY